MGGSDGAAANLCRVERADERAIPTAMPGGSECAGDRGHGIAAVGSAPDTVERRIDGVDRALRTSIDGVTADVERGGQSG